MMSDNSETEVPWKLRPVVIFVDDGDPRFYCMDVAAAKRSHYQTIAHILLDPQVRDG